MLENELDSGVLLPLASVAVLGQGLHGMAVLRHWGLPVPQHGDKLASLLDSAGGDADSDVAETVRSLELFAGLARSSVGWLHLRPVGSDAPSAVVLTGDDTALLASLHGPMVEWLVGSHALIARVIARGCEGMGDGELHVTGYVEDTSVGGLRFHGSQVDVSAKTESAVDDLERAATTGLPQLIEAFVALLKDAPAAPAETRTP